MGAGGISRGTLSPGRNFKAVIIYYSDKEEIVLNGKHEIPVLDLSGSNYEIGFQHGSILRDLIREFYHSVFDLHLHNLELKTDKESLMAFCRKNIGFMKSYAVELCDELQGIADGSGLVFEDIVFLNSFLELEDLRPAGLGAKLLHKRLWGCTSFNVRSEASADQKPYIGQTFDMEEYYGKYNVIFRIHPEEGPVQVIYSMAGILGLNGMNSEGIAVVINKLVAVDAREGVIYPFVIRKALAQTRIGDSFGSIVFTQRASGMNYQLTCKDNIAWCIETSAGGYELLPIEGAIAHTNHYLSDAMRKYETPNWLSHGGSYVRQQVSAGVLKENIGKIDIELLKGMTKDHKNYPRCICAHGFDGQEERDAFATVAAMIYDPSEGLMYACHQNPCTHEYKVIHL